MTRTELIIQILKVVIGLALGAYFVWWSLEVLDRLSPNDEVPTSVRRIFKANRFLMPWQGPSPTTKIARRRMATGRRGRQRCRRLRGVGVGSDWRAGLAMSNATATGLFVCWTSVIFLARKPRL
jgi:hypothetical protein